MSILQRAILLQARALPSLLPCLSSACLNSPQATVFQPCRHAGHNKWSNIKRGKALVDAKRSQAIGKACKKLQKALRKAKGEYDPQFNAELARAMANCQANNVPKETIQRQFERAKNAKLQQAFIVVKGPGPMAFLLEVFTENRHRAIAETNKLLRRTKSPLFKTLELDYDSFFEPRSTVLVAEDPSKIKSEEAEVSENDDETPTTLPPPLTMDQVEEIAIEYGAQDVTKMTSEEGYAGYEFVCDPFVMTKLVQILQKMGHAVLYSETEYLGIVKHPPIEDRELQAQIDRFYEEMEEHDELEKIYSNIEEKEDDLVADVA